MKMATVLQRFWYDRTIRTQLLIAIGLINLVALVLAGLVWILNARYATRVEMEASIDIAKQFARMTIQSLAPDGKVGDMSRKIEQLRSRLRVARLRHVRIYMADAAGHLVQLSPQPGESRGQSQVAPAPHWFAALVEPEVAPRTLSVVLADPSASSAIVVEQPVATMPKIWSLGTVVIAGEPADEIAEVWLDVKWLALVLLAIDLLVLAVLYLVLGRMLDPMASVVRGLVKLEAGEYATRLTPPRLKELGAITDRFNRLAQVLGRARAENARLYGQLITVQEDERRELANELHDEASPCLFGIMANALSVQRLIERRRDRKASEIKGHVAEILKVTDRLKIMNRVMLKKLRPVALGRVALPALVEDLIGELQRRYPDVSLSHSVATRTPSHGEAIDLTVYRCIQEGVTNAIRHGNADTVKIELLEKKPSNGMNGAHGRNGTNRSAASTLQLMIHDDGRGIPPNTAFGFGLTVMRERVNALGGSCAIQSVPSQGATLRVIIPVTPQACAQPSRIQRIEAH